MNHRKELDHEQERISESDTIEYCTKGTLRRLELERSKQSFRPIIYGRKRFCKNTNAGRYIYDRTGTPLSGSFFRDAWI